MIKINRSLFEGLISITPVLIAIIFFNRYIFVDEYMFAFMAIVLVYTIRKYDYKFNVDMFFNKFSFFLCNMAFRLRSVFFA